MLFQDRDQRSLQVLWKDKGRADIALPLPGVAQVQVIRIDGSRRTLTVSDQRVTLTVSEDPLLLLYEGGPVPLPPALEKPAASLEAPSQAIPRNAETTLTVVVNDASGAIPDLIVAPFWTVKKSERVARNETSIFQFAFTPLASSSVREGDLVVTLSDPNGARLGELYLRSAVSE